MITSFFRIGNHDHDRVSQSRRTHALISAKIDTAYVSIAIDVTRNLQQAHFSLAASLRLNE